MSRLISRVFSGLSASISCSFDFDVVLISRVMYATAGVFRPFINKLSAVYTCVFSGGSYNKNMVRKIFLILIPFIFLGCQSKPTRESYLPPPPIAVIPEYKPDPSKLNPKIIIDTADPDNILISVSYSADSWAFINGVEIKNGAGDIKKYSFKSPRHTVLDSGAVMEICVYTCQNLDIPPVVHYYADEIREFLAVGDITARPLADKKSFGFMQVIIN